MDTNSDADVLYYNVNEIDIDEDYSLNEVELNKFDEFESTEIEFPDDVDWDEFSDDMNLLECLPSIPLISFIDDESGDVQVVTKNSESSFNCKESFNCQLCGKVYLRVGNRNKHQEICVGNKVLSIKKMKKVSNQRTTHIAPKQVKKQGLMMKQEAHICVNAKVFVVSALNAASTDPINNLIIPGMVTPGNKVKSASNAILKDQDSSDFSELCQQLVRDITNLMSGNLKKDCDLVEMWRRIHEYTTGNEARMVWEIVCSKNLVDIQSPIFVSLLHFVTMQCVKSIMAFENKHNEKKMVELDIKLSVEEQEVIRYVSGYLVFSLKRKYNKMEKSTCSKEIAVAALQLLSSLQMVGESNLASQTFLEFSKKYLEKKNSGGLVKPNDAMFIFVRGIENVVRTVLNINLMKSYQGQDLRDVIEIQLCKSTLVDSNWEKLSRLMPNKALADSIKIQLIRKWVDIRARSFVNSYVQTAKRKLHKIKAVKKKSSDIKLSSKAEPAMRKKLT